MSESVKSTDLNINFNDFFASHQGNATRATAREYTEPTLEIYACGQLRLRGIVEDKVNNIIYDITRAGVKIYPLPTSDLAKELASKFNYKRCITTEGDPNMRAGKLAREFYELLANLYPEKVNSTGAGKSIAQTLTRYTKEGEPTLYEWKAPIASESESDTESEGDND